MSNIYITDFCVSKCGRPRVRACILSACGLVAPHGLMVFMRAIGLHRMEHASGRAPQSESKSRLFYISTKCTCADT